MSADQARDQSCRSGVLGDIKIAVTYNRFAVNTGKGRRLAIYGQIAGRAIRDVAGSVREFCANLVAAVGCDI